MNRQEISFMSGRIFALLLIMLMALGCMETTEKTQRRGTKYARNLLGLAPRGITEKTFVKTIEKYLDEERYLTAEMWVQRWPDMSQRVLFNNLSESASYIDEDVLTYLARVHDSHMGYFSDQGWNAFHLTRRANSLYVKDLLHLRDELTMLLVRSRYSEAAALTIPLSVIPAPGDFVHLDVQRLYGISLMLGGQYDRAEEVFEHLVNTSSEQRLALTFEAAILRCENLQMQSKYDESGKAWNEAVRIGTQLLTRDDIVPLPHLWMRLTALQLEDLQWPEEAGMAALNASDLPSLHFVPLEPQKIPLLVKSLIGKWHMNRREYQDALLVFKEAETLSIDDDDVQWTRVDQARVLLRLNQTGAASAILGSVSLKRRSLASKPASALLGTIELKNYRVRTGLSLLKRAIEEDESGEIWPGRHQSEADLGIAYIMNDQIDTGRTWLSVAQENFAATGKYGRLFQCLKNEKRFLEYDEKSDAVDEIDARIEKLEQMSLIKP